MNCDVGKATEGLGNELWRSSAHSPNISITSHTSQLILQHFCRFTYVTTHSPTLLLLHLHDSSFSNPSFASPTSQALHLHHLAKRPCISTLVTKFLQNIVADTDKNKTLIDCHKCSSSFLSIVKSHPLKIPASVLEKVRAGSCHKLFLIDCSSFPLKISSGSNKLVSSWADIKKNFKLFAVYSRGVSLSMPLAAHKLIRCINADWLLMN